MVLRKFSLLAFLVQISLGNICMMQMASAKEMDMPSMQHEAHCENCSPDMSSDDENSMDGMDCGSGHCLMHAKTTETAATQGVNPLATATLPPSPEVIIFSAVTEENLPPSTAPPDTPFNTNKVVLRF